MRRVRNELRKLLINALARRIFLLGEEKRSLDVDKDLDRIGEINGEISRFLTIKEKSICYCQYCKRTDLDMQYCSEKDTWYCPFDYERFEKNYEFHRERFEKMSHEEYENEMSAVWDPKRRS